MPLPKQCGVHCSRNILKQVLTGCEGQEEVVEQCNADQGCGNGGTCVDACTAAELTRAPAVAISGRFPQPDHDRGAGGCFAAMIANTWDRAVAYGRIRERPARHLKSTYTVIA